VIERTIMSVFLRTLRPISHLILRGTTRNLASLPLSADESKSGHDPDVLPGGKPLPKPGVRPDSHLEGGPGAGAGNLASENAQKPPRSGATSASTTFETPVAVPVSPGSAERKVVNPTQTKTQTPPHLRWEGLPLTEKRSTAFQRPLSPDLTIYKGGLSMFVSGAFRVSSVVMTLGIYTGGILYGLGGEEALWYIDWIKHQELNPIVFPLGKLTLALPFMFHYFTGIRHFLFDSGFYLNAEGTTLTARAVVILSAASALILAAL